MRSPLVIAGLALVAGWLLAGCDETYRWSKPDVTVDQRKKDFTSCRAVAEKKASEQFSQDLGRIQEPIGGRGGAQALRRDIARLDARQFRNEMSDECPIIRGRLEEGPVGKGGGRTG